MKKAEWPTCQKPKDMLYALLKAKRSGRKFRLFACACCRSVWHLLSDSRNRQGVETAEALADGFVTDLQALERYNAAAAVYSEVAAPSRFDAGLEAAQAAQVTLLDYEAPQNAQRHASIASYHTVTATSLTEIQTYSEDTIPDYNARASVELRENGIQATWLRCIFGNPFRPVTPSPLWHTSTTVALASQMYESRDFSAMPILADALQDAGCNNEDVLSHCRGPGPHVRGCWVVDLVLGKK
ncbi:Uncharacterized protein OS=Sorangium cellulosum (strain So ce56) GN=sce5710 PE=4 SV=1 [Gemmata massiliana]|uniref:SMI1/KNR4 family protein n=1 Tax=Gemmata massiliana TaxID=1210884 RepID=A0A6P2CWI3_9BACT|nr:hypothetical protein [Gemmata massiliana]VTR93498.1 Uncharacterized protein OS=Sorangium cellulosum (strain So ce56) GN=sce5710 PE=4 SV=1 [Gemmata massiliana]